MGWGLQGSAAALVAGCGLILDNSTERREDIQARDVSDSCLASLPIWGRQREGDGQTYPDMQTGGFIFSLRDFLQGQIQAHLLASAGNFWGLLL